MFWVSRMKLRKFSVLLSSVLLSVVGCAVVTPPKNVTVLVDGLSGFLQCVLEQGDSVTWLDTTETPSVAIFGGNAGSDNIERGDAAGPQTKYGNFYIDSPSGSGTFNLNINNAEFMDDEGEYTCQPQLSTGAASRVSIEVPTDQVTLSCESCSGDSTESTCECTCLAQSGYPQSLTIGWATTDGSVSPRSMEPAEERNGKYDFTGTADITITENEATVTCSVMGYVNQAVIVENFSDRVSQEQVLASPTDCALMVSDNTVDSTDGYCTVKLTCSCQGVPPINSCKFYNGTKDNEITEEDSCVTSQPVQRGTDAMFWCSGSNGINFVKNVSDPVPYECMEIEPTPSATTPNKTGDADPGTTGSPNGLVIGLSVVGSLIAVAVIVIIILFVLKRWKNPTERKNAVTATTGDTSSAPVYGVIDKSKKKKSDKTDGNGMQMSEAPEYAAVSKPLNSEPKPAPRSSQPPPTNSTEKQELQYADIDHSNRTPSNQIRQPAEAPTEYATVQSVIV